MPDSEPVDQIIASARDARQELADLEQQLQSRIDEIDFDAFREERGLTADEKIERKQLRASQTEVREAFAELAFVTVRRLDESDEVGLLKAKMDQINRGLKDDFDDLKKIAAFATKTAKVADSVAKVVEKVAAKAAQFLG
jgi:hypothetical protein